jgi:hypothetical protein
MIPEPALTRTYSAKIDSDVRFGYLITLSDATFATDVQLSERSFRVECGGPVFGSGLGCNQLVAGRDGDEIEFQLIHNSERMNDEFGGAGGTIVELIDPHTRLDIGGRGRGRFDGRTIQATLTGHLFYCSPLRGDGSSCAFAGIHCETADLRLTFTRKQQTSRAVEWGIGVLEISG